MQVTAGVKFCEIAGAGVGAGAMFFCGCGCGSNINYLAGVGAGADTIPWVRGRVRTGQSAPATCYDTNTCMRVNLVIRFYCMVGIGKNYQVQLK